MDRIQSLLGPIHKGMKIVEIGPGYNPAAPRSEGWNSFCVDHISREDLIKKYAGQMPVDRIEDVDFIWNGGPLESAVPANLHGTFDACIASHVIEHTPDMIAFLDSISCLLKKDGILALAIPDKRATFDFFQPVTLTDKIIEAHLEKRTRHTRSTAFSNLAYNIESSGLITWLPGQQITGIRIRDDKVVTHGLSSALDYVRRIGTDASSPYIDFHVWRLTPSSFRLLALELTACNIFPFTVEFVSDTSGCEFMAHLRNRKPSTPQADETDRRRIELLKQVVLEKRAEIDSLACQPQPVHPSNDSARHSPTTTRYPRTLRNLGRFLLRRPLKSASQ